MSKKIRDPAILNPDAGTAEGITEVKRQEALLKTGALQSAIFNSANFSSIATDAKGVIQIFNVGAERMLGYTAADVMNKITPADISDLQEVIARAKALSVELGTQIEPGFEALVFKASRGIEDIYELTYIRKDGSRFPAIVSVTALRDAQGAIIGYLLIGTDNTARKQNELALVTAQRDLQTAYEMIVRKNAQLEESNRARSEFLAAMSHELKTPLNAVIGFSDLLREGVAGPVNEEQRGFAQDIYDAGTKLLGLLSDIIDFSRLEAGYTRLELKPVTADVWLKESVISWRERAAASGLTFTLDIPAALGTLWLDAIKARQIVVNLLSNAVKFTKRGGCVTIVARRVAQAQAQAQARLAGNILPNAFAQYLEIEVCDTGIGFSPELLPRLFEPFHQGDAILARQYEGIGLGLAMVKRLVDLHGGAVQAYNAPDHGACVTVWLPWRENAEDQVNATSCSCK